MNETELERLVVRLTGDMSQYVKMLQDAQKETKQQTDSIKDMIGGVSSALAALGAGAFLKDSLREWKIAEDTAIELTATLKANGREVENTMERYKEFASAMQEVTTVGDDTTLALLKVAEQYGKTGGKAEEMTKKAMALSEATGTSPQMMMRLVAALESGNTEMLNMLSRVVPQLRLAETEAEKLALVEKLIAQGMDEMAEKAQTGSGRLAQLTNDFGDLKEQIGEVVSQGIKPFAEAGSAIAKWAQTMPADMKATAISVTLVAVALVTVANTAGLVGRAVTALTVNTVAFTKAALLNPYVWVAAAAAGILYLAARVAGLTKEMERYNETVEEAGRLNDQLLKAMQDRTDKFIKNLEGMTDEDKTKALTDQIRQVEKELNAAKDRAETFKKVMDGFWTSIDKFQTAAANLREENKAIERLRSVYDRLKDALTGIKDEANKAGKEMKDLFAPGAELGSGEAAKRMADHLAKIGDVVRGVKGGAAPGGPAVGPAPAVPDVGPGVGAGGLPDVPPEWKGRPAADRIAAERERLKKLIEEQTRPAYEARWQAEQDEIFRKAREEDLRRIDRAREKQDREAEEMKQRQQKTDHFLPPNFPRDFHGNPGGDKVGAKLERLIEVTVNKPVVKVGQSNLGAGGR